MPGKYLLTASLLVILAFFNVFLFPKFEWGSRLTLNPNIFPKIHPPLYPCPVPTQELPPEVDPVVSPTNLMTQTIIARFNNAEAMTVYVESGSFWTQCSWPSCSVTILLKPNTINHITVAAKYKLIIDSQGCTYGGYTITTQQDRFGNPLDIEQIGGILYPRYFPLVSR